LNSTNFALVLALERINDYCLLLKGTEATFPFNETTLVFKVMGKMFCLGDVTNFDTITVKCDPVVADELKEQYEQIRNGYHMNSRHWITVSFEGLTEAFIFALIRNSYELVVQKLPKKDRIILETL
jgi:predicted DNA-binding protein (MmcQ/YjbR family)